MVHVEKSVAFRFCQPKSFTSICSLIGLRQLYCRAAEPRDIAEMEVGKKGALELKSEPPRFVPKKASVIPARRRSVKQMMFDRVASLFCRSAPELSGDGCGGAGKMVSAVKTPSSMMRKKREGNGIFPCP